MDCYRPPFVALFGMDAASALMSRQVSQDEGPWQIAVDQGRRWGEAISRFRQWERQRILIEDPTPEEQKQHREALKWFLRGSRVLFALLSDPEFPDRQALAWIESQIWLLEESWKMVYEPISEEQADRILAQAFPEP
jgi:hypothetical protein